LRWTYDKNADNASAWARSESFNFSFIGKHIDRKFLSSFCWRMKGNWFNQFHSFRIIYGFSIIYRIYFLHDYRFVHTWMCIENLIDEFFNWRGLKSEMVPNLLENFNKYFFNKTDKRYFSRIL
jgi:hypothetical protein